MGLYHDTSTDPLGIDEIIVKHYGEEALVPNYVIRNNELVWAKSGMYLSGAVNYELEGNPTVIDGVASNFSAGNYLKTNATYPSAISSFEMSVTFTTPSALWSGNTYITAHFSNPPGGSNLIGGFVLSSGGSLNVFLFRRSDDSFDSFDTTGYDFRNHLNATYTATISTDMSTVILNVYDSEGNSIYSNTYQNQDLAASFTAPVYFGSWAGYSKGYAGSIDMKRTYIKVNGQLWFYGKNYATQNIAPVPANYTYGTTTTSAIGYVDMRTQTFTAAPEGTIFYEEEPAPPPVIDANTLACWHLDTGYPSQDAVHQYTFANANSQGNYQSTGGWDNGYFSGKFASFNWWNYASMALTSKPLTVDFHYKPSSYPSDFSFGFGQNGGVSNYLYGMKILASGTKIATTAGMVSAEFDLTSKSIDINDGNWHHIAFEFNYSAAKVNYYVDGKYIGNGTVNSPSGTIYFMSFSSDSTNGIDELRVSDINRYNGQDFTVPTVPYESA